MPFKVLHCGLALACVGRVKEAHEYLEAYIAGKIPGYTDPFLEQIAAIRDSLAAGDGNHLRLIATMEIAAAADRGLTRPPLD